MQILVRLNRPYSLEHVLADLRDNPGFRSISHHAIRFSGSRLTVRKDTIVVSLEGIVQQRHPQILMQALLPGIMSIAAIERPIAPVERERLLASIGALTKALLRVSWGDQNGLRLTHLHDTFGIARRLSTVEWPYAYHHLDVAARHDCDVDGVAVVGAVLGLSTSLVAERES